MPGGGGAAAPPSRTDLNRRQLATASVAAAAPDAAAERSLGALLLSQGGGGGPIVFAVGSTLFSYLFLRAHSIPVPLAWLGVVTSLLFFAGVSVQEVGFFRGPATYFIWIPLAVFEVTLGLWLLVKGVAPQAAP
jgi:hypothetical protein